MASVRDLTVLLGILLLMAVFGWYMKKQSASEEDDIYEHFDDYTQTIKKKHVPQIYDSFYSSIYDTLFGNDILKEFEWYQLKAYTIEDRKEFAPSDIHIVDLGCGIGKHLKLFSRDGYHATGLDLSMDMLQKARLLNPDVRLVKGDYMNSNVFKPREFSHAVCLFYTVYYTDQPKKLFENVNRWLKPKGYFAVHLVNPKKFDPVLEKSSKLIPMYHPQRHTKKRNTTTKLKFNKFQYVADWDFDGLQRKDQEAKIRFTEHFLFKDSSKHIEHQHDLTMYSIPRYVKWAEESGFQLIKIIDLLPAGHDFSYMYIFQKQYERANVPT